MRRFWRSPAVEQPAAAPPGPVTAEWVQRESGLPWLPLLLDFPYEESRREVMRLLDRFVEHRAGEGRGWRSLCLHGLGSELTRSPRHYGYSEEDAPYGWTAIAGR